MTDQSEGEITMYENAMIQLLAVLANAKQSKAAANVVAVKRQDAMAGGK